MGGSALGVGGIPPAPALALLDGLAFSGRRGVGSLTSSLRGGEVPPTLLLTVCSICSVFSVSSTRSVSEPGQMALALCRFFVLEEL